MARLKFDSTEPSHLVGLALLVGGIVFSAYQLATGADIYFTTLLKSLALGSVYALIALGFVLIFKATEVVNFSQGALAMIGALFISFMVADENLPIIGFFWEIPNPIYQLGGPEWIRWGLSVIVALGFAALLGLVIERVTIRPMIGQPLFSVAVITLGLEISLRVLANDAVKISFRSVDAPWGNGGFNIGAGFVNWSYFAAMITAAVAFVAVFFFYRSRMGISMRAVARDQEAAMAQGINIGRVFAIAWGAGAVLAALGGLFATQQPIKQTGAIDQDTSLIAFRALPAVILGGLDSVQGALIGGLMVGTAEIYAGQYLSGYTSVLGSGYPLIVPYVVMIIGLLVKPYGLFGTPEIRRV
ncbi:MAG: branched-chain amino acid ABC transporter permease [Ilumatobacteraceae bacterium]|nr:branched-chain amino acid ABC transporter permease [Ilumatobacteraceae bacterium]